MNKCDNPCNGCLWASICDSKELCDDYTPMDSDYDELYYEKVLEENRQEYQSILDEING